MTNVNEQVTFATERDWPTPNNCRRAAAALDTLTAANYGAILRAYADAEDERFAKNGPIKVRKAETIEEFDKEDVDGAPTHQWQVTTPPDVDFADDDFYFDEAPR